VTNKDLLVNHYQNLLEVGSLI